MKRNTLAALTGDLRRRPLQELRRSPKYAQQLVADNPNDPKNLYALANLYEKFNKIDEAEETTRRWRSRTRRTPRPAAPWPASTTSPSGTRRRPGSRAATSRGAQVRPGHRRSSSSCAAIDPNDPPGYQKVATFYWDKAYRDPLLNDEQKDVYADKGLEAVDKALQLKPDYFEAVIYKGLLFRVKARRHRNPRAAAQYLEQAQTLQKQGLELKKQQAAEGAAAAAPAASGGQ